MVAKIKSSLFLQVVLALILGLIVGVVFPTQAQALKPLGDLFIRFIQLLIAPIVFCVVVNGISGVGNIKKVGTVGVKTIFYFECVTTIALALGLVLGLNSNIGMGMNIDPSSLDASAISAYTERAQTISQAGGVSFLMNLVPTTVVGAFAKGDILQVLVFSIIFACSLNFRSFRCISWFIFCNLYIICNCCLRRNFKIVWHKLIPILKIFARRIDDCICYYSIR